MAEASFFMGRGFPESPVNGGIYLDTTAGLLHIVADGKTFSFPSVVTTSLEECSWSVISQIAKSGLASSYWSVGQEKTFTVDIESTVTTYTAVILDFNKDDDNTITFGMKECLSAVGAMGDAAERPYWRTSSMRGFLNGTIRKYLPAELISVIRPVNKLSYSAKNNCITETSDMLWLLGASEILGPEASGIQDEGGQYAYYSENTATLKPRVGDYDTSWWLRTNRNNASEGEFLYVDAGGVKINEPTGSNRPGSAKGISFCFVV